MSIRNYLAAIFFAASATVSAPAFADSYVAEADSWEEVDINVCSPRLYFRATGDGDTDLDFYVTDPSGETVYVDDDHTDYTWATLRTGIYPGSGRCRTFTLHVRNLGSVWNEFQLYTEGRT